MSEILVLVDHVDGAVHKPTTVRSPSPAGWGAVGGVRRPVRSGRGGGRRSAPYGAEKVYVVDDAQIRGYLVAPKAEALQQLVAKASPARC